MTGLTPTHYDVDLHHHNWGQALSFAFANHRHVTFGYNHYVVAGPPYQVVKAAGLNLPTFHYLHVCIKPDWCDATVGLQLLSGCCPNNWEVDKGRISAHTSVDTFGRPDVFC
jgi:hypothetical protein